VLRGRSRGAHLTLESVEELAKLVRMGLGQDVAEGRHPQVAFPGSHGLPVLRLGDHSAQLVDDEGLSPVAQAGLAEER